MTAYENGQIVETCEPDIYFNDESVAESSLGMDAMQALLAVTFELGTWAGKDPVKQFAARTVMRQESECPRRFAARHEVSASYVRQCIRKAKLVIGITSAQTRINTGAAGESDDS